MQDLIDKIVAEVVKDLNAAKPFIAQLRAMIAKAKTSPIIASILDKVWPGLTAIEDTVLADLDFLSSLDDKFLAWMGSIFKKP
jgi:hypothetical protein